MIWILSSLLKCAMVDLGEYSVCTWKNQVECPRNVMNSSWLMTPNSSTSWLISCLLVPQITKRGVKSLCGFCFNVCVHYWSDLVTNTFKWFLYFPLFHAQDHKSANHSLWAGQLEAWRKFNWTVHPFTRYLQLWHYRRAEWFWKRLYGPQSLKYLLSGPLRTDDPFYFLTNIVATCGS